MSEYHWIPRYVAIIIDFVKILMITIKIQKFGPHLVASKITEELRKQKINRKGWILFCKRFQTCSFMRQKKSFQVTDDDVVLWFLVYFAQMPWMYVRQSLLLVYRSLFASSSKRHWQIYLVTFFKCHCAIAASCKNWSTLLLGQQGQPFLMTGERMENVNWKLKRSVHFSILAGM